MDLLMVPLWSSDQTKMTAARLLGYGKTKVRDLAATGELPSIMIGGRRFVVVAELQKYVERLAAKAVDA